MIETKAPPKVPLCHRQQNDLWTIRILNLDDEIELTSIGLRFPVADIYDKTRFSKRKQRES